MGIGISTPFGYAVGGIARFAGGAMEMVGGMANLASKSIGTIGEVVKAASKDKAPDQTVNEENLGMIAAAGQQKVVSGRGTIPITQGGVRKPNVKSTMATEKLLAVAVNYLKSIDETLKKSVQINNQQVREEEDARKESEIEDGGENKISRWLKEKRDSAARRAMNAGGSLLKTAAIAALLLGVTKIASLDTTEIKKLKRTLNDFEEKWGPAFAILSGFMTVGWLTRTLFGKSLARGLWQLFKLIPKNPFLIAAGMITAGIVYGLDQALHGEVNEKTTELAKKYGIIAVGDGKFVIDPSGKVYDREDLPQEIRDIIDLVYGIRGKEAEEAAKRQLESKYIELRQGNPDYIEGYGKYARSEKPLSTYSVEETLAVADVLNRGKSKALGGKRQGGLGMFGLTGQHISTYAPKAFGANWKKYKFDETNQNRIAYEMYMANRSGDLSKTGWAYFKGSEKGQYEQTEWNTVRLGVMKYQQTLRAQAPDAKDASQDGILAGAVDLVIMARNLIAEITATNTDKIKYADQVEKANAGAGLAERIAQEAKLSAADVIAGLTGTKDKQGQALTTTPRQRLASAFNAGKIETLDPTFPYDKYPIVAQTAMQGILL